MAECKICGKGLIFINREMCDNCWEICTRIGKCNPKALTYFFERIHLLIKEKRSLPKNGRLNMISFLPY